MFICYTDLYTVTACTKGLSVYVHFQRLDSIWQIIPELLFCYALNKQKHPPQATQTKPNKTVTFMLSPMKHKGPHEGQQYILKLQIFLWKQRLLKNKDRKLIILI